MPGPVSDCARKPRAIIHPLMPANQYRNDKQSARIRGMFHGDLRGAGHIFTPRQLCIEEARGADVVYVPLSHQLGQCWE